MMLIRSELAVWPECPQIRDQNVDEELELRKPADSARLNRMGRYLKETKVCLIF